MATVADVRKRDKGASWLANESIQAILDRFPGDDAAVDACVLYAKICLLGGSSTDVEAVYDLVAASTNPADTRDVMARIQDKCIERRAARHFGPSRLQYWGPAVGGQTPIPLDGYSGPPRRLN